MAWSAVQQKAMKCLRDRFVRQEAMKSSRDRFVRFRLRSASTYTLTSSLSSAATDKQAEQRRDQTYCEPPPLKLAQASLSCREGGPAEALLVDVAASAARSRQSEKRRQWSQTLRYSAAIHGDQPLA